MKEFDIANEHVKDSINAFLEDASGYPAVNTIGEFNLKFFKSICIDCTRRNCIIRHMLYRADKIASCNYFTTLADKLD